jgi:hypothetical protein
MDNVSKKHQNLKTCQIKQCKKEQNTARETEKKLLDEYMKEKAAVSKLKTKTITKKMDDLNKKLTALAYKEPAAKCSFDKCRAETKTLLENLHKMNETICKTKKQEQDCEIARKMKTQLELLNSGKLKHKDLKIKGALTNMLWSSY